MRKKRHYFGLKEYRYVTSSGITLSYIQTKNIYTNVTFNISSGSTYKNNESSLYYAHLIPSIIKDSDLFSFSLKNQITFSSSVNYLNTVYKFNSFSKCEEIVIYFLDRLNNLVINNDNLNNFIKNSKYSFYNHNSIIKRNLFDNIFSSSPIRSGNVILESSDNLSVEEANNYFLDAYRKSNINVFITGPLNKKEIQTLFHNIESKISYSRQEKSINTSTYNENYTSVNRTYSLINGNYHINYLSMGIKLQRFDQLLNRFDILLIPYLYLTKFACFDLNSEFIKSVNNAEANYIDCNIESSNYDGVIYFNFEVDKEEKLMKFLNDYTTHLVNRLDKYVFNNAKRFAFASLFEKIIHPYLVSETLNYQFSNVIEYTRLLKLIKKVKYDDFISFVSYFQTFPKSIVLLKSSELE